MPTIQGQVKWFDPKKGYGFITGPQGQDVFVHYSQIQGDGFRSLKDGEDVNYDLIEGDKGSAALKYIRELILQPGSSIGLHAHNEDEEIYYVLSGSGIMIVDNEEKEIACGDIVLTKSGSFHGLNNHSSEILKIFVVCASL